MDDDVVVARQFLPGTAGGLAGWCGGYLVLATHPTQTGRGGVAIRVPNGDGSSLAWLGDWIIRNAAGEFSVQSDQDFTARHEPLA